MNNRTGLFSTKAWIRSLVSSGVSWPKSSKDMKGAEAEADLEAERLPVAVVVKAEVTAAIAHAMAAKRRADRD